MKKFILYNDYATKNIKDFKDNFGDYLHTTISEYDILLNELKIANIFTRDVYKKSLYNILSSKDNDNQTLIINAYSFGYLVFKDKFFINNNPHLILDSAILIAKILNIKNIDILIRSYYNKETLINAIAEAEDFYKIESEININIYDENNYKENINIYFLERQKYILDLETVIQFGYFAHMGLENFSQYGNDNNNGTCLISFSGDIPNADLYEFQYGSLFNEIIKASGYISYNNDIKCVFTNGFLNAPTTLESLSSKSLSYDDINIGNGGICFISENRCMLRVVMKIIQFAKSISCTNCMPCSYGFNLCEYYLNKIILGKSNNNDYKNLINAVEMIIKGSSCLYIYYIAKCILETIKMFEYEFIYALDKKITLYSFINK
ncbi:NADH-ubiquinone oxidoreductase-F iron-sulfur binding region domain-containing protein [uncultured Brachyspira sp.]|uniref:NADH-ubiquinone oxidoreductase-F iron-sulfur binding region domain-containing protein n=1 Tax=uncultured Brachyspira sp. TaxID=221953 RepID=UPI002621E22E|nr:NADH-ubiquinone oxidoreductase-F iron-sulfur binding region domain-containing protein [uncultured Brachyspira sp.]